MFDKQHGRFRIQYNILYLLAGRNINIIQRFIPQQKMRIIQVVVLLVMPGAAIAMGILVWRRRKH